MHGCYCEIDIEMNSSGRNKNKKSYQKQAYVGRIVVFLAVYAILAVIAFSCFYVGLRFNIGSKRISPCKTVNAVVTEKALDVMSAISENETFDVDPVENNSVNIKADNYTYEFLADLSEYEQYMDPEDRDAYLRLINHQNRLDENYIPDDLIDVENTRNDRAKQKMRLYAAKALEALFLEAAEYGIADVTVTSAYRSYAYQTQLYEARVEQYMYLGEEAARAKAATIVTYPGASEHQSGLCADMHNIAAADISFAETDAAKWLKDNCFKFGFILRYPEDKTDITGISFEPWHFRFVGRYHASRMHELDMCLEEYIEYLDSNA